MSIIEHKLWTRQYINALIVMFGMFLSISLLMSLTSVYASYITGNEAYVGLIVSAFTVGAFAVRFIAGNLVDKFGSRRVILCGLFILILSYLAFLFSQNILQLMMSRLLQGMGFGIAATATGTLISNICHPQKLLEGIGYSAIAQSLSSVIGPAMGFWIVGEQYDRFSLLFIVAAAIGLLTFFVTFTEKIAPREVTAKSDLPSHGYTMIHWKLIIIPLMILFFNSLAASSTLSFLSLYAISLNITGIGTYFTVNAIGMIASRFVMNKLVRQFGEFQMITFNILMFSISIFMLTRVTNLAGLLLIAFPAGFAMGAIAPIINSYVIACFPSNKRGLANALYFSSIDVGYGVGSVLWGIIADMTGYSLMFIIVSSFEALVIILALTQLMLIKTNQKLSTHTINEVA